MDLLPLKEIQIIESEIGERLALSRVKANAQQAAPAPPGDKGVLIRRKRATIRRSRNDAFVAADSLWRKVV